MGQALNLGLCALAFHLQILELPLQIVLGVIGNYYFFQILNFI